jgi:hypothetical protein
MMSVVCENSNKHRIIVWYRMNTESGHAKRVCFMYQVIC